jgi:hypothetical protein
MSRIRLTDLSAVQLEDKNNIEVLGFMAWYSIGEQLINRETLREYLVESGLDDGYMPAEIRIPDAFRRASKAVECKKESNEEGVFYRYLVREVVSDRKMIQRNIVKETVDSKTARLKYAEKEAILVLEKEEGVLRIASVTEEGSRLGQQVADLFQQYKSYHDARAIRSMCLTILKSMSPTSMRSSGGVYFVPAKYQEKLSQMIQFIRLVDKGEGDLIPLINTKESLEMIRHNAIRQINETFSRLRGAHDNPDLTAAEITAIVEDTHLAMNIVKDYREMIVGDLNKLELSTLSFEKMLRSVQSRKKDRKSTEMVKRQIRF